MVRPYNGKRQDEKLPFSMYKHAEKQTGSTPWYDSDTDVRTYLNVENDYFSRSDRVLVHVQKQDVTLQAKEGNN
jgi:hypothetical protein